MELMSTRAALSACERLGLTWQDLERLAQRIELTEPAKGGSPQRRALLVDGYIIFAEPDGNRYHVIGLARRNTDTQQPAPPQRSKPKAKKKRHGAGTALPTSVDELISRIEEVPGWSVKPTRRHYMAMGPHGETCPLPKSTNEFRALRNAVTQLRHAGLDVRR